MNGAEGDSANSVSPPLEGPGEAFPLSLGPEKKITPVQTHGGPSNLNLLTTKSNANSY